MYLFQKQRQAHADMVDKLRALVVRVRETLASDNVDMRALRRCKVDVETLEVFSRNPLFTEMERRIINVNAKKAANWR